MSELLKDLNLEQKRAVTFGEGPLLIVAGAGTGKTTVITCRLAWLIDQKKAKGDEILALTFTDKAAEEMEERVDRLLPYGYLDLWISTFHAFAERILKNHGLEIGLSNDFKLLNQTEQWLLVRKNLDKFKLDYYRPLGNPTKFIHALIKLFSRAKDEIVFPEDYLEYVKDLKLNTDSSDFIQSIADKETVKLLTKKEIKELTAQEIKKQQEVAEAFYTYQKLLLDSNALDFGDLINYCLKLFQKRPLILNKYRQQFKYILVDEFQDTNYAQYELIKLLAAPKNNLTVVADDDQSIYKFRGASISNILQFKDDYPKATETFLTKNYRSTQDILDLSYKFIQQNNPYRLEVKLVQAKDSSGQKFSKKLKAQNKEKGIILHLHFQTAKDEVKGIIKQVIDLKDKDNPSASSGQEQASWNDFAILCRTNEIANYFVLGFSQTEIPYQFVASRGLYYKPIILDILAYLKLLDNYHESPALYRILSLPIFGLKPEDLVNLNYWASRKGWSLYETLQHLVVLNNIEPEDKEKINKILQLIEKHSRLVQRKSVGEVVLTFLEDSGYLKLLTKTESLTTQQATNYLNQFYKKIIEFENSVKDKSVKNFLELIELELEAGEEGALQPLAEEGPEAVKIMTVHSAKGLEFSYVFMVNLVDRRFPTLERKELIELPDVLVKEIIPEGDIHLQEERRLFYVAMTRAKKGLFFTSAEDYGGQRRKKLSRFLLELKDLGFPIKKSEKGISTSILLEAKTQKIQSEISLERLDQILPAKFSFTQLKAFESCPYQYRFAHILRVPVRGKAQFSFGKTIHATLHQFFGLVKMRSEVEQIDLFGETKTKNQKTKQSQKPIVSLDELLEIYENAWIDDWFTDRKSQLDYKEKGKIALKEFYQKIKDSTPIPKYLERPFNLKIGDGAQEYTLKGVIDRVDDLGDGIEIIDYKTGGSRDISKMDLADKEQLLIYQLAAQEVLKERVKNLSYYYIEGNKKVSFLGIEKDLKNIKEKIIKTIQEIKKGKFPPKPGRLCQWCDFNKICEYRAF